MPSNHYTTTIVKLTLDQTVAITESFYASLSWTKLFTELGGSLGLWLGVGMTQLFVSSVNILLLILLKLKELHK